MKKGSFLVENSWTFYTAADTESGYAAERQGGAIPLIQNCHLLWTLVLHSHFNKASMVTMTDFCNSQCAFVHQSILTCWFAGQGQRTRLPGLVGFNVQAQPWNFNSTWHTYCVSIHGDKGHIIIESVWSCLEAFSGLDYSKASFHSFV